MIKNFNSHLAKNIICRQSKTSKINYSLTSHNNQNYSILKNIEISISEINLIKQNKYNFFDKLFKNKKSKTNF